ncbi:hypothetical protein HDU97_008603 [Phlyctochytrium planicorne]|nr:hypothetical protein HDU97_008603 [Phlyctochytrium planicorne]
MRVKEQLKTFYANISKPAEEKLEEKIAANPYHPFHVIQSQVSLAGIWNYKDTRFYTLLPQQKEYLFAHNKKVHVRGGILECMESKVFKLLPEFYNIYIRLRREKLRKLGQTMAANLNLKYSFILMQSLTFPSYFDEANTSQHHVIRHFRSDKQVFSFRKGSVAAKAQPPT